MTSPGGGLFATTQERGFLPWNETRSVKAYPSDCLIVLRSATLISPVLLYCTPENYDLDRELVQKNIPVDAKFS